MNYKTEEKSKGSNSPKNKSNYVVNFSKFMMITTYVLYKEFKAIPKKDYLAKTIHGTTILFSPLIDIMTVPFKLFSIGTIYIQEKMEQKQKN